MPEHDYIPALRFHWLTRFYDPVVRFTTRENAFKAVLIKEATLGCARSILDVGCGTGGLTMLAKRAAPQARVVGLDADAPALTQAGSKAGAGNAAIEFIQANAATMPFRDGTFDRIVSSLFFHHLRRDQKLEVLGECLRVLRNDGSLTFADWTKPSNIYTAATFLTVRILDGFEPTEDNARGSLPDLCRLAGFTQVHELQRFAVPLGTIAIISAAK